MHLDQVCCFVCGVRWAKWLWEKCAGSSMLSFQVLPIYTYIYIYLSCILLIKPVELWPATNTMDSLRNDDQTFDLDVVSLPWGKILGCRAAAAVTVAGPFWSLEIWTTKSDSLLLHWSNKVNLQVQITRLSSIETDYVSTTSVSVLHFKLELTQPKGLRDWHQSHPIGARFGSKLRITGTNLVQI